MQRDTLLNNLRGLLREALRLRFEGGAYAKLAEAQALADGYMRALEESGVLSREALLDLVVTERRNYVDAPRATMTGRALVAA